MEVYNFGPLSRDKVIQDANLSLPIADTVYSSPIQSQERAHREDHPGGAPFLMLARVAYMDREDKLDTLVTVALFAVLVSELDL